MCRSSIIASAHINVEDMEKGDGSENCTELCALRVALLEGIFNSENTQAEHRQKVAQSFCVRCYRRSGGLHRV